MVRCDVDCKLHQQGMCTIEPVFELTETVGLKGPTFECLSIEWIDEEEGDEDATG